MRVSFKNCFQNKTKSLAVVALTVFFYCQATVANERLLMSHAGMEAYLDTLDCRSGYQAKLIIKSPTAGVFDGERIELQRLIGQVRAVVSIECPMIKRMTAKGMVNNQLYFAGATDKSWGWRIVGLYAAPPGR